MSFVKFWVCRKSIVSCGPIFVYIDQFVYKEKWFGVREIFYDAVCHAEPVEATSKRSKILRQAQYDNTAAFYSKNRLGFRQAIPVDNFYKLAGGGYLSTSEDIASFGQAYLEGKAMNTEMRADFLTSAVVNGKRTYYGLGWQVSEDKKGRSFYGHVGNGVGGYSNFFVYPEEQMVFAILVNCTNPGVQDELDEIVDVLINLDASSIL